MVNRDDTFVNSHIQIPKLLLKRFHNDKISFVIGKNLINLRKGYKHTQ